VKDTLYVSVIQHKRLGLYDNPVFYLNKLITCILI